VKIGQGELAMNSMPYQVCTRTKSASAIITDSAAAATAIACGVKTKNGVVGLDPNGARLESVAEVAKKYGVYVVFGMAEKKEDKPDAILYNSAIAIGPDGIIDSYQKMHPFETESVWCEKGEKPFMFDTPWGPVGISICFIAFGLYSLRTDDVAKAYPYFAFWEW
jgi:apolipoprotein N-acyltransferase